jgi:acyl carrier protein
VENLQIEVYNWIVDWFEKHTSTKKKELLKYSQENYFEKGWLDSFTFISFIMDLEQKFTVRFANDEFQNRDFSTINGLSKIVSTRIKDKK